MVIRFADLSADEDSSTRRENSCFKTIWISLLVSLVTCIFLLLKSIILLLSIYISKITLNYNWFSTCKHWDLTTYVNVTVFIHTMFRFMFYLDDIHRSIFDRDSISFEYLLWTQDKLSGFMILIWVYPCLDLCFTWTIYIEVFLTETVLALNTCYGHRTNFRVLWF